MAGRKDASVQFSGSVLLALERIGTDVHRVMRGFGAAGAAGEVVRVWQAAAGREIARNAWPARVARDGTLHVATSSSAWAFELTQLEALLRGRLHELLGEAAPKRLRFTPGNLPERGHEEASAVGQRPPQPEAEDYTRAAELASAISDHELRALVARAAAASLAKARRGV